MADDVKQGAAGVVAATDAAGATGETPEPVPLTSAEVAQLAKTGCRACRGAGRVIAGYAGTADEPVRLFAMCRCVGRRVASRADVGDWNGRLCWVPRGEPGPRPAPSDDEVPR